MTIRPAVLADVPTLVDMGGHFLEQTAYRDVIAHSPAQMTALASFLIAGEMSTVLVAEQSGAIVGMMGLVAAPHFISGELSAGEVFWWMEPDARGAGLRLLRAAEQWARDKGANGLQMIAPDERVGAVYQRLGYRLIERSYFRRLDVA